MFELRSAIVGVVLTMLALSGCNKPQGSGEATSSPAEKKVDQQAKSAGTADPENVKAAKARIGELGARAKYTLKNDVLTEIVIQDGSNLTAEDITLFGKLSDLDKLQILNFRAFNNDMLATLTGLKGLKTLAITNSAIDDAGVETIVKSFPALVELDLSSNTNMTSGVVKILTEQPHLQRLILVQNRINDIGAQKFANLKDLRALDLRGNMEAGDMALEVIAGLPKLTSLKHRSTAVTNSGIEQLERSSTLESLLMQDFAITDEAGNSLAKLSKLSQLEVFRCQGFGSEGVLALKGLGLTRLMLRDLPTIDDRALEVFDDLPKLKRLTLYELTSLGDSGLAHLGSLKSLESLDIWIIPQMSDATIDVIATLPNLTELKIRGTAVTGNCVDKILGMTKLQSLMLKENGVFSDEDLKKLAGRKWKLDVGTSGDSTSGDAAAQ